MEKVEKYEKIILEILQNEAIERPHSTVEDIIITDNKTHHYQLIRTGWEDNQRFVYTIVFHFHIDPNGKIWLLQNNTDIPITDELLRRDVPASDIVLGFHPPEYRQYTGLAAAKKKPLPPRRCFQ